MEATNELLKEIEHLKDFVNTIQNNVNFSLGLTWAILAVVFGILGVTGYFLIKTMFNSRFEEESKKIDNKIIKYIKENPQMINQVGKMIIPAERSIDNVWFLESIIRYDGKKDVDFPPKIELYYENINKQLVKINDFHIIREDNIYKMNENDFIIQFKKPNDIATDYTKRILYYNISWSNKIYNQL